MKANCRLTRSLAFATLFLIGTLSQNAIAASISTNTPERGMPDYDLPSAQPIDDSPFGFGSTLSSLIRSASVTFPLASVSSGATINSLIVTDSLGQPHTCPVGSFSPAPGSNMISCNFGMAAFQMPGTFPNFVGFQGTGTLTLVPGRTAQLTLSDAPVGVPEPASTALVITALGMFYGWKKLRRQCS